MTGILTEEAEGKRGRGGRACEGGEGQRERRRGGVGERRRGAGEMRKEAGERRREGKGEKRDTGKEGGGSKGRGKRVQVWRMERDSEEKGEEKNRELNQGEVHTCKKKR